MYSSEAYLTDGGAKARNREEVGAYRSFLLASRRFGMVGDLKMDLGSKK